MKVPSTIRAVYLAANYNPHRPSLIFVEPGGTQQYSAGELASGVEDWARGLQHLRREGAQVGECIAVLVAPRGFTAYAALIGAMRAGLAGCILPGPTGKQDPRLYWESHRSVLLRIRPVAVIGPSDLLDALAEISPEGTKLIDAAGPPPPGPGTLPTLDEVDQDDVRAILQHSSGTTGLKKGVELTHGKIRWQVQAYAAALGMTREDKVVSWLPLYHDMGLVTSVLLPVALGAIVVSMDPFDWLLHPASILLEASRYRAAFCWLPNFAFAHLVNVAAFEGPFDLAHVRAFIDCSEPCRAETLEAFAKTFAQHGLASSALSTCYAMAETVFAVTQAPIGRPPLVLSVDSAALMQTSTAVPVPPCTPNATRIVSCGPPIDGTRLKIAPTQNDSKHRGLKSLVSTLLRPNKSEPNGYAVGEVLVLSKSIFEGYHNDAQASAAAFANGWYRTGDLGFIHKGELYITGRLKDLIIVNGRNVYAHDIEALVSSVDGVKPGRSAAFGIERKATGTEAVVVIVESNAAEGPAAEAVARRVRDAVSQTLGLVPYDVLVRPPGVLVKTTSGKVSREGNRRRYLEGAVA